MANARIASQTASIADSSSSGKIGRDKDLRRRLLSHGEASQPRAEILVSGLEVNRPWVLNAGVDAVVGEPFPQAIPRRLPDDIGAVDVRCVWPLDRNLRSGHLEASIVAAGEVAPLRVPSVEMPKLDTQDGCLQFVHTAVEAPKMVLEAPSLSIVPQQAKMLRVIGGSGDDHAAVTVAAEVLRRVEAEAAEQAKTPYLLALVRCPMSLAGILDDFEPSGGRNREQRLDIGGVS